MNAHHCLEYNRNITTDHLVIAPVMVLVSKEATAVQFIVLQVVEVVEILQRLVVL